MHQKLWLYALKTARPSPMSLWTLTPSDKARITTVIADARRDTEKVPLFSHAQENTKLCDW